MTALSTVVSPEFRTVDGLKIRCADSAGSHEPTVVLTSPWPESLAHREQLDRLAHALRRAGDARRGRGIRRRRGGSEHRTWRAHPRRRPRRTGPTRNAAAIDDGRIRVRPGRPARRPQR